MRPTKRRDKRDKLSNRRNYRIPKSPKAVKAQRAKRQNVLNVAASESRIEPVESVARACPTCNGDGKLPPRRQVTEIELRGIATAIERSPSHVSRLFSGNPKQRRDTTLPNWKRIAEYLGVSLDELYQLVQTDRRPY